MLTAAPPPGPLLVVSPHLDDAALSCAALLARREPVDVMTVFAEEPEPPVQGFWDRRCGFATSAQSMAARRLEERKAFADTAHRPAAMELLELQYTGGERDESEAAAIRAWVARWIGDVGSGTVALPAGAGRRPGRVRAFVERRVRRSYRPRPHPDHVFVRDAVLEALASRAHVVPLLYEELPYLFGGRADAEAARVGAAWGLEAVPLDLDVDRAAKAARIAAYESQVPHLLAPEGMRLDMAPALPPRERYWRLSRSRASRSAAATASASVAGSSG